MAGKVGKTMSVNDGYGFTLWDDTNPYKIRLTIAFGTEEEAKQAERQMRELFDKAVRVTGPPL